LSFEIRLSSHTKQVGLREHREEGTHLGNLDYKQFAEQHRPHIHPPGGILFATYRLAGSIPRATVLQYKAKKVWLENEVQRVWKAAQDNKAHEMKNWLTRAEEFQREWFVKFENILHQARTGPMWLQHEGVAAKVAEGLHRLDGQAYRLDAYCVMSNHVHVLFKPFLSDENLREIVSEGRPSFNSEYPGLSRIMHSLKGRSARECNLILSRNGQFWEHESFDRVVRAGRLNATVRYVVNNPVMAGLAVDWREWPWTYCRAELCEKL